MRTSCRVGSARLPTSKTKRTDKTLEPLEGGVLTVGSLFAGIGGIELGLERTGGFKTVWQVENDEYATRVLEKHWPNVRRWDDVRTFCPTPVDIVCGGFPCQPFSSAARGRNNAEDLWSEMYKIIEQIRPRLVLAENVAQRAIDRAAWSLQSLGYRETRFRLGADDLGADHPRHRWWVCAYANDQSELHSTLNAKMAELPQICEGVWGWPRFAERCRVSDGVSSRVDRLRCLGNAVVPAVAQWIGERILEAETT